MLVSFDTKKGRSFGTLVRENAKTVYVEATFEKDGVAYTKVIQRHKIKHDVNIGAQA